MKYEDAMSLCNYLREKCPYDTGALFASIQAPQGNEKEWIIVIGNDDSSINGTPTNQYASLLNFNRQIKNYRNRHYHWVNIAIKEWLMSHSYSNITIDDLEDDI